MISLEHLGDGTPSARNFERLERIIPDTYGLSVQWREVAGMVTNTGGVNAGVGFSVSRSATGTYAVVFDTPFPFNPTITIGSDNGSALVGFWSSGSVNGFTAHIVNLSGTAIDAFWNFRATVIR